MTILFNDITQLSDIVSYWQVSKRIRDNERCGRAELHFCSEGSEPEKMWEVSSQLLTSFCC